MINIKESQSHSYAILRYDFTQISPNSQGVILTQKHLSFSDNFVHFTKKSFSHAKNEIFII